MRTPALFFPPLSLPYPSVAPLPQPPPIARTPSTSPRRPDSLKPYPSNPLSPSPQNKHQAPCWGPFLRIPERSKSCTARTWTSFGCSAISAFTWPTCLTRGRPRGCCSFPALGSPTCWSTFAASRSGLAAGTRSLAAADGVGLLMGSREGPGARGDLPWRGSGCRRQPCANPACRPATLQADKRLQLADWRIRPLTPEMETYARADTHSLLYIHNQLKVGGGGGRRKGGFSRPSHREAVAPVAEGLNVRTRCRCKNRTTCMRSGRADTRPMNPTRRAGAAGAARHRRAVAPLGAGARGCPRRPADDGAGALEPALPADVRARAARRAQLPGSRAEDGDALHRRAAGSV